MKYLKEFENHSQYEEELFNLPRHNVSICDDENGPVHYDEIINRTVTFIHVAEEGKEVPYFKNPGDIVKIYRDGVEMPHYIIPFDGVYGERKYEIVLAEGITELPELFEHESRQNIISLTTPIVITSIGNTALKGLTGLTTFKHKNNLVSVGVNAFARTKISEFDFSYIKNLGGLAFAETELSGDIKLPMVETIGASVFYGTNVETITIGNNLKELSDAAFAECASLNTVSISGGTYTTLGSQTFSGCTLLQTVTVRGNYLTTIGENTFASCENLKTLNIISKKLASINCSFADCNESFVMYVRSWNVPTLSVANAFGEPREGLRIRVLRSRGDVYKAAENWSTYADNIQANLPR